MQVKVSKNLNYGLMFHTVDKWTGMHSLYVHFSRTLMMGYTIGKCIPEFIRKKMPCTFSGFGISKIFPKKRE